jgi:hypothetical protein
MEPVSASHYAQRWDLEQLAASTVSGGPVNPADLLALLKSATTVRDDGSVSGPGWTGTRYSFSVRFGGGLFTELSGTVSVDRQGRVRQLVTTLVGAQRGRGGWASSPSQTRSCSATSGYGCRSSPRRRVRYTTLARSSRRSSQLHDGADAAGRRNRSGAGGGGRSQPVRSE